MLKWSLMSAAAAVMTFGLAAPAEAQRSGESRVGGALTERQARAECRQSMRGARESRASINRKMQNCIREKMVGGR